MKNWKEIYEKEIEKEGGHERFINLKIKEKKPTINEIIRLSRNNKRILEAGCGTGVISIYLSNLNLNVTSIDVDDEMLDISKKFIKFTKNPPKFEKKNLFNLDYKKDNFDITFSHGVLEHFSDEDIITIVNNELKISKNVLISIPSDYYKEKDRMYGNERFMSVRKWESVLSKTNGRVVKKFGYYFQNKFTLILNFMMPKIMINHAPYICFILEKSRKIS